MIKNILIFFIIYIASFSYSFKQIGKAHGLKIGNFGKVVDVLKDEDKNTYFLDYLLGKLVVYDKENNLIKEFTGLKKPSYFNLIEGKLYISESLENRIVIINNYSGKRKILGNSGMREGEFFHPGEILNVKDHIYIADEYNNRIQIFNKRGEYEEQIMLPKFKYDYKPYYSLNYSLQYEDDKLYVLDNYNKKLYVFKNYRLMKEYNLKNIKNPTKLYKISNRLYIYDSVDNLLVSLSNNIIKLDIDFNYQLIGLNHFYVENNLIYMVSNKNLYSYDIGIGKSTKKFKFETISKEEYVKPVDIAKDKDGNIYILDQELEKIIKYNEYGQYVNVIENIGEKPLSFHIDDKLNILVSFPFENKIKKYNKNGKLIYIYGGYEKLPSNQAYYYEKELKQGIKDKNKLDKTIYNLDVTVDKIGNFYILDSKDMQIKKLSPFFDETKNSGEKAGVLSILKGTKQSNVFGWDELNKNNLTDIFYFDKKVYVLDKYYNRINVLENGKITQFHEEDFSKDGLNSIYVNDKFIYVVDSYNFSIYRYNKDFSGKQEISFLKYGLIPLKIFGEYVIFKKHLKDYETIYLVLNIQSLL